MSKSKLLITGLNSLIGWCIYEGAKDQFEVVGTYRRPHAVFEGDSFLRIDMDNELEVDELIAQTKPDYVIHTRGICDLDVCETTPDLAHHVNVRGTELLTNAVKKNASVKSFIFISTDHVFNGEKGDYEVHTKPNPKHVFGRTKALAEAVVQNSGLPYKIIRPGLVIGDSVQGNVGPKDFLLSRLREDKASTYFVDEWRNPVQGTVLAEKVLGLLNSNEEGIFHIAGDETLSRYELAQKLAKDHKLSQEYIVAKHRSEDEWAHIRPEHLTLRSNL